MTIRYEERSGEPFQVGERIITPLSKVLQISLPGLKGGILWNRPLALKIRSATGEEQILPVPDLTRQALLTLFLFSLILTFVVQITRRQARRKEQDELKGNSND